MHRAPPICTATPSASGIERILFVDDDETMVISARSMLQRFGYKVTALTDAQEALKVFSEKSSEFDLVITDHVMPHLTGEDIAPKMLRIRSDIPIILCTGNVDAISSEKAISMGLQGLIAKPFSVRECAELVRRVLDQKEPK